MDTKILTVQDVFSLDNRGVVLFGQQTEHAPDAKIGDSIKIMRPDKTILVSQISEIDSFSRQCFTENTIKFVGFLIKDLSKTDVPNGSIVYLAN